MGVTSYPIAQLNEMVMGSLSFFFPAPSIRISIVLLFSVSRLLYVFDEVCTVYITS